MIVGIGVDVAELTRIGKARRRFGAHYLSKVFTDAELFYCMNKTYPDPHLAARFAAKEAFRKALGSVQGMSWRDVEVEHTRHGRHRYAFMVKLSRP